MGRKASVRLWGGFGGVPGDGRGRRALGCASINAPMSRPGRAMNRTIVSPRSVRQAVLAGLASLAGGHALAGTGLDRPRRRGSGQSRTEERDTPPDLVGLDIGHDDVRVSQHAGKVVVVSFWATWCGYCLKELPVLANIQRSMGRQNVQVIAVNVEDRDTYRRVRWKLDGHDLINAYDPRKAGQRAYSVNGIPTW